jgi:membrane associated rhomboid family serine protease
MEQYGLVPDRGVISLLAVLTAVWLLVRLGVLGGLLPHLVLIPARAIGPEPWQLVTSMFINGRLGEVMMAAVTLLFFGNAVERVLGAGGVWKVFVVGGFGGALFGGLLGRLLAPFAVLPGSFAGTTAMLTAFAASAAYARVNFFGTNVRPGTMAWIWLGISVLFELVRVEEIGWVAVALGLAMLAGGALAGWIVGGARRRGSGAGLDVRGAFDKMRMWRLKRRYRVLTGGRDGRDDKRYLN